MTKQLQKSLQGCLSKIKKPTPQIQLPSRTFSSSTSWILRGCKHPKTPSFAFDDKQNQTQDDGDAATLSDIDRFLVENFKSLYKKEGDQDEDKAKAAKRRSEVNDEEKPAGVLFESPKFIDPPEILRGSHRFFVASGSSSSLMEEARTSLTLTSASTSEDMGSSSTTSANAFNDSTRATDDVAKDINVLSPDDFITVLTYSPTPYDDFRKSMHEMIEARLQHNGKIDWEFMEELLFCYLNLNDKKSYRFILRAFVDLIVVLRENSGRVPEKPRNVRSNSSANRRKQERKIT